MDGELIGVSLNGFLDVPCKNSGVGFRFFDLPFDLDFPFTFAGGSAKRTFEPSLDDFLELEYPVGSEVESSLVFVGIRVDRESKSTRNGLVSLMLRKPSSLISTRP